MFLDEQPMPGFDFVDTDQCDDALLGQWPAVALTMREAFRQNDWLSVETVGSSPNCSRTTIDWFAPHKDQYEQVLKHPAEVLALTRVRRVQVTDLVQLLGSVAGLMISAPIHGCEAEN